MIGNSNLTSLELLSRILELEFGERPLQHYGLFPDAESTATESAEALPQAQHRFETKLLELIQQSGSGLDILVVGDTLLPLARKLALANNVISWIGSEPLVEDAQSIRYAGSDFVASKQPSSVDVLVHEGSIRYLDQMAILSKCRDLLAEQGQLILCSEFIGDDSQIKYSSLPNLSSFDQLAARLGFEQPTAIDLSDSAARTLEMLRPLCEKHGAALLRAEDLEAEFLPALQDEIADVLAEFASGRRVFQIRIAQREREASHEWAGAEFGDIATFQPRDIAELFEKSFNVPFNEALWNWKYAQGEGRCVVARLDKHGDIVAHYGGAPRKIAYFGEDALAIQPCDVMVHPSLRKQYGKGSLFFEVAATFLEREIGNTVKHLLGFGFPNQKTMNISKRLGLYEKTDDFVELCYPPATVETGQQGYALVEYDAQDDACVAQLDSLWASMRSDYDEGIVGVRDADYINYRYIRHPFAESGQYRCVLIRESNASKAFAFAVLKQHAEGRLLMDLVCPVAAMKRAIAFLNQEISGNGSGEKLRAWVSKSGVERLSIEGAILNELGIEIPCNSWNPGPSAELLYGAWWLMAGDMDFV